MHESGADEGDAHVCRPCLEDTSTEFILAPYAYPATACPTTSSSAEPSIVSRQPASRSSSKVAVSASGPDAVAVEVTSAQSNHAFEQANVAQARHKGPGPAEGLRHVNPREHADQPLRSEGLFLADLRIFTWNVQGKKNVSDIGEAFNTEVKVWDVLLLQQVPPPKFTAGEHIQVLGTPATAGRATSMVLHHRHAGRVLDRGGGLFPCLSIKTNEASRTVTFVSVYLPHVGHPDGHGKSLANSPARQGRAGVYLRSGRLQLSFA